LQDYGALHNITSGDLASQVMIYAERAADSNPLIAQMRTDWPTIGPLLRIMRNQGPNSINGGGTPRRPMLPGVVAGLPAIKV
jgi:hypothetical protein